MPKPNVTYEYKLMSLEMSTVLKTFLMLKATVSILRCK